MKNFKFILAAAFALAALSCDKVETTTTNPETNPEDGLVTLTLSTGEATKTHLVNGTEIHWDSGDKIKIFTDENYYSSNAFSLKMPDTSPTPNPNGNFAKFSGEIASKSTKFWVVYPESKAVSCPKDGNGANLKVSIPSSQDPTVNSFANDLNVSVAKGVINEVDNGTLGIGGKYELTEPIFVNFKNVCALLKFTAPANASEITSVTISANEVIAGEMIIDYSADEPKVTGVSGSKSITMTGSFEADKEYYFVVAPVSISGISMTIQANGETRYIAKKVNYALEPGVAKSLGSVDLAKMTKVSATAAHQSPKNVLSGTDVTFDLGQASASSLNLTIKKTDNTATRSARALKSAYSSDSDWPYLPQGAYTFSGSFSSNGVNVIVPATSFSVPVPSGFSVAEFTPFTSYSKYLENKLKEANSLDGSTIYVNVTHNISPNIIANTNYSQLITVEGNTPVYNSDKSCVCFEDKDWKAHTISEITWTFDGIDAFCKLKTPVTVNVTGIPERLTLYGNQSGANASSWSFNNVKWEAGKCIIFHNGNDGNMISPCFYVPQDKSIGVNCSYGAQYYVGFINIAGLDVDEFSADVRVGLTSDKSAVSTDYKSHSLVASKNFGESFYQITDSFDLTHSLCYVSFHHNSPAQPKRKPLFVTYSANYWYINLQKVNVEYR